MAIEDHSAYYNRAVGRSLDLMEWLARNGKGSLPDLCAGLGLPKSTAYSILMTLVDRGYVDRAPDGLFALGLRVVSLGSALLARMDIREWARPVMRRLVAVTQETAHLGVLDRGSVIYIERVNSPTPVHVSPVGFRSPPTCSALGLALLSGLSEAELVSLEGAGHLVPCTPRTVADLTGLRTLLDQVRRQGYAVDDRTQDMQVRSVAAPVRDHRNQIVAALSCSGIVGRLTDERLAEVAGQVMEAAREISRALGCQGCSPCPEKEVVSNGMGLDERGVPPA